MFCLYKIFLPLNNLKITFNYLNTHNKFIFKKTLNLKINFKKPFFNNFFLYDTSVNYVNKLNFNNFNNFIKNVFKYNNKILLIDSDAKKFLPFYIFSFGFLDIQINKNFFFFSKKKIIYSNFLYYYNVFLSTFKIKFFLFFDYLNYINYFKYFLKFNLPIGSIIFNKLQSVYLDYYFIIGKLNYNFYKFYIYNLITLNFFYYYKLINYNNKFFFLKNLYKYTNL